MGMNRAKVEMSNTFEHSQARMTYKSLTSRKASFPAMFEKDGRLYLTYETKYHKTVSPYVLGLSTFLANARIFPEIVKITGLEVAPVENYISQIEYGNSKRGKSIKKYVTKTFNDMTGQSPEHSFMDTSFKGLHSYSRFLATTLLSFPTAGTKNLGTGTAQTAAAFDAMDMGRGFLDVMKGDAKKEAAFMKTAAVKQELGIYKGEGKINKFLEKYAFRWGFMAESEKFNRKLAIYTSLHEQKRLIKHLQELQQMY